MKPLALLFLISCTAQAAPSPAASCTAPPPAWRVHFSPGTECRTEIVGLIGGAKRSVYVSAYSFTSRPIANALVGAHRRGVDVRVLLDRSDLTAKGSELETFREAGVPTWIDGVEKIAHNKVMIVDGSTTLTGSYNFTHAAERSNAENCLVITDRELAAKYTENWSLHRAHSETP